MLFDLRGRRRRAVQATYLILALLMGGGLVFFGIGGDVSGGLFDAFSVRGGRRRAAERGRAVPRGGEGLAPRGCALLAALSGGGAGQAGRLPRPGRARDLR